MTKTPLTGGPAVIERLMYKRCGRYLNAAEAQTLWDQCKARLHNRGMPDTVTEAEESPDGGLDTLPREDVMSALAFELTGSDWPSNGDSAQTSDAFVTALRRAMDERGYAQQPEVTS